MRNLPRPGIKPVSSALAGGGLSTGPPGNSWLCILHSSGASYLHLPGWLSHCRTPVGDFWAILEASFWLTLPDGRHILPVRLCAVWNLSWCSSYTPSPSEALSWVFRFALLKWVCVCVCVCVCVLFSTFCRCMYFQSGSSETSVTLKGCCWITKDTGIIGLWKRGIQSWAGDKAWSLSFCLIKFY